MKNILSSLPKAFITLLAFCWTGGPGGGVHAASCADVQGGDICSNGNFRPDQLVVLRANPIEVDPDGKTCQQSLEEIDVDCDVDGNYATDNNSTSTSSSRMDILRLVSQQCCDDLLGGSNPPTCDEWNWDEPCGGSGDRVLAKNEPLLWPLNGEDMSGRTCQQLLDEKKRETYIRPCGDGTDPNNNFATDADYQKIQTVVMELNLASCCRPPQADTTTTGTSADPGESTTTTTGSTENNNTSGATSILSYSAFWRITAISAALLVGSTVVGSI